MQEVHSTLVPVDQLYRRPDARPLNMEAVAGIAESVQEGGRLINPLLARPRALGGYEIIAGSHRFAALDSLGWSEIPCFIVHEDDLRAELAMIDENLCRAELSASERAQQTARRKAIYEAIHPETKHGGDRPPAPEHEEEDNPFLDEQEGQVANFATSKTPTFSKSTAKSTGKSERAVRLDAERGEKVCDDAFNLISGTKLDTGVYLDKLKKLPPNEQVQAAKRDLAYERKKAREGKKPAPKKPSLEEPPKPTYQGMMGAIEILIAIKPADYLDLCPPNKRAVLCQQLSGLSDVFQQVIEDATT